MKLEFPALGEDLDDAFNSALAQGAMERDSKSRKFWARFQLIASDVDGEDIVADWFYNALSDVYTRVPRKEGST